MTAQSPMLTFEQEGAIDRFARLKVGAIFMEQGMGKSRVAVELANSRAADIDHVLWVAPYSVVETVRAEIEKWGMRVPVRVLGYETLSQSDATYLEVLDWCQGKRLLVVADESIFIKNHWSRRHQRMMEIRRHAKYALCLNGTPMTRDPWDLKRQMDWLSPLILDMTDRAFRGKYFTMIEKGHGEDKWWWWEAYAPNLAHLRSLMDPYVYEARLRLDLDETERTVEHTGGVTEQYEQARDDFLTAWEQWGEKIALYRLLGELKRIAATDPVKCEAIAEHVAGEHAVVFCQYVAEQAQIASHLAGRYLLINGDTTPAEREQIFDRFKVEEVPLLLTYGTGSFGLNLQHVNQLHFASLTFDYGRMEQARSRIRRIGQDRPIWYSTHVSEYGIDALIAQNLGLKSWMAALVRHELDPRGVL